MIDRLQAVALDDEDRMSALRERFVIADPALSYLDGNSLGRLPRTARDAVMKAVDSEWGEGLVRSWHEWIDLPERIGDQLAPLIGAGRGEVLLCDQTSINLYKLACAALAHTGRRVIVGDDSNFPSDRYVLRAAAEAHAGDLREAQVDPHHGPDLESVAAAMDDRVGLLSLSLVSFRSGALADLTAFTDLAHRHGALVLWDLSHAAGAVPVELSAASADLAVGCTYKYLNGGPGAPAFLFVREDLQQSLHQPIPGWFGHDDLFAFEDAYRPATGIRRFAVGTPPILSLRAAEAGIALTAEIGIDALRERSIRLTEFLIRRCDARLEGLGFSLCTPRDPSRRGSHVSLLHPDGYAITRALIARGVVPDFRTPDTIRLGVAPLYTGFAELWDAVEAMARIVETGEQVGLRAAQKGRVT